MGHYRLNGRVVDNCDAHTAVRTMTRSRGTLGVVVRVILPRLPSSVISPASRPQLSRAEAQPHCFDDRR
ncbi:hypothetical protein C8039_08490 [Halogeometricum sp. wsp3]|nr:hypothetical protein C8039_08490 [Halogeometricum sp. wsp3]